MPRFILPHASVGASAISIPSGRTNGGDIADISNREAADAVEVESSALKLLAPGKLAAVASLWHRVSAPDKPVDGSKRPTETNARRPEKGVRVSGVLGETSKQ